MKKNVILRFFSFIGILMVVVAATVWFFDPFYQYHAPFISKEAVLYERETQMPGSIRNLKYDSVLVGSSVAENCNTNLLDEALGTKTIKLVKGSGSTADLVHYLKMAHDNQNLKNVYYSLDLFSMMDSTDVTVVSEYSPNYLFTSTVLDDFAYLFNKDVLFKKIPLEIVYSLQHKYQGGAAYNWAADKTFSVEQAKKAYAGPGEMKPTAYDEEKNKIILENIQLLEEVIKAHPDTQYVIFFPPYSLLRWDEITRAGLKEQYQFALSNVFDALLQYKNVKIYYFQMDEEIIMDLNFYMDQVHFSTQINDYMLQCILDEGEKYLVSLDNRREFIKLFSETCDYIVSEGIYQYYERP